MSYHDVETGGDSSHSLLKETVSETSELLFTAPRQNQDHSYSQYYFVNQLVHIGHCQAEGLSC